MGELPDPIQRSREILDHGPEALAEAVARKLLGWPKICKLAHAFLWEYNYQRLKLAQLLGQLGVFLTCSSGRRAEGVVRNCPGRKPPF